jgi:hypothetical protein
MKWVIGLVFLAGTSYSMAADDFWSSNGGKVVTKGVPEVKKTQIQESKAVVLPAPGADTYCMPSMADPKKMIDAMKSMFPGAQLPSCPIRPSGRPLLSGLAMLISRPPHRWSITSPGTG